MAASEEKYQKATVTYRKDHAEGLWTIRVRPERRLAFKPGQYATLGLEEGEKIVERAYSICSSPLEGEIEFFFELVPKGHLTPPLYLRQVGDTLLMRRQAQGLFTLDGKSSHREHFLVCTVTGVAPYVSMVRTLAREARQGRGPSCHFIVMQAASRSWEFAYCEELEGLAREFNWLKYIPTVSRPWEDPAWRGEVGRIEDVLRKYLDALALEPSQTTVYLCGQPQMIVNAKGILQRRGFSREFIREEIYWLPKKDEE
jgi:ferredoxin--NADP+ reductase